MPPAKLVRGWRGRSYSPKQANPGNYPQCKPQMGNVLLVDSRILRAAMVAERPQAVSTLPVLLPFNITAQASTLPRNLW